VVGLTMGLTDEVLAARLGVSLRTCRRHVANVFELLGAESRFQAGVLATARGWVPSSAVQRLAGARGGV
jgi:DNA-binding NarL/FixJ family response regulator